MKLHSFEQVSFCLLCFLYKQSNTYYKNKICIYNIKYVICFIWILHIYMNFWSNHKSKQGSYICAIVNNQKLYIYLHIPENSNYFLIFSFILFRLKNKFLLWYLEFTRIMYKLKLDKIVQLYFLSIKLKNFLFAFLCREQGRLK